jgi:hypothetical protein
VMCVIHGAAGPVTRVTTEPGVMMPVVAKEEPAMDAEPEVRESEVKTLWDESGALPPWGQWNANERSYICKAVAIERHRARKERMTTNDAAVIGDAIAAAREAGRAEERAAVVEWLQLQVDDFDRAIESGGGEVCRIRYSLADTYATDIEAGAHLPKAQPTEAEKRKRAIERVQARLAVRTMHEQGCSMEEAVAMVESSLKLNAVWALMEPEIEAELARGTEGG